MFSKEEIINEIQRLAQKLGKRTLTQKEFELNSMIPVSTVKYYMGTWASAVKEADLESSGDMPAPDVDAVAGDDDLLRELGRLFRDNGYNDPDSGYIDKHGKYNHQYYHAKWNTVENALFNAKTKFPDEFKPVPVEEPEEKTLTDIPPVSFADELGEVDRDEITQDDIKVYVPEKMPEPQVVFDEKETLAGEGKRMVMNNKKPAHRLDTAKIRFIPETFKPIKDKEAEVLSEPIDFRGLKYAPSDVLGVVYVFGLIAEEMGFVIENLSGKHMRAHGLRCMDITKEFWSDTVIDFSYKSSEKREKSLRDSGLLICWVHDWKEAPFEVLELKSLIRNFNP